MYGFLQKKARKFRAGRGFAMTNMRFAKRTAVAALAAALLPGVSGAAENLGDITKDIRIDPLGITVSGVSSGAYMAVQFQVAYSSR